MVKAKLFVGQGWAHLKVVSIGSEDKITECSGGYEKELMPCATCACTCGGEIKLWLREWKGQKYVRDCGCGVSAEDGKCVILTATVPHGMDREIRKYGQREGVSRSRAVVELVQAGLDAKVKQAEREGVEVCHERT